MTEEVLGIDLGTSFSVIATLDNGTVTILENDINERKTPSCTIVATDSDSENWLFGQEAVLASVSYPERAYDGVKRFLGLFPTSASTKHSLEYIFGKIINNLLEVTNVQRGVYKKAAVSVPHYFNEDQRDALLDAVTKTSIDHVILVNDIVASIAAYARESDRKERIVVIDAGAGGSSVGVAALDCGEYTILDASSRHLPGGEHLNDRLVIYMQERIFVSYGIKIEHIQDIKILRRSCEVLKQKLSRIPEAKIEVFLPNAQIEINEVFTRTDFEHQCIDLLTVIIEEVFLSLSRSQVPVDNIDTVLLVGGTGRVPYLRYSLETAFKCKVKLFYPDEGVAMGLVTIAKEIFDALQQYTGAPIFLPCPKLNSDHSVSHSQTCNEINVDVCSNTGDELESFEDMNPRAPIDLLTTDVGCDGPSSNIDLTPAAMVSPGNRFHSGKYSPQTNDTKSENGSRVPLLDKDKSPTATVPPENSFHFGQWSPKVDDARSENGSNNGGKKEQFVLDLEEALRFLRGDGYPARLKGKCKKGDRKNFRRQCEQFSYDVETKKLLYVKKSKKSQPGKPTSREVVIDKKQRQKLVQEYHEGASTSLEATAMSSHRGRDRLIAALSTDYYWPGMFRDAKRYCQRCITCKTINPATLKAADSMHPVGVPSRHMAQIGVDITQMPVVDGFKFMIVAVDYFTKWVEAAPITDKSMTTVAKFLYTDVICRHGCPEVMITDQGREFCNSLSAELMKLSGGKHRVTSPYHPQANGLVERANRSIKNAMLKVLKQNIDRWPSILPGVLFAQRSSEHASTKFSPFFHLYGRHPRLPYQLQSSENSDHSSSENEEAIDGSLREFNINNSCDDNQNLDEEPFNMNTFNKVLGHTDAFRKEVDNIAAENIKKAQEKQKRAYDKRHTGGQVLKIGAEVFLLNQRRRDRKGGKHEAPKSGPYTIQEISDRKTVTLKNKAGVVLKTKYPISDLVVVEIADTIDEKRKERPKTMDYGATQDDSKTPNGSHNSKKTHGKDESWFAELTDDCISSNDAEECDRKCLLDKPKEVTQEEICKFSSMDPETVVLFLEKNAILSSDLATIQKNGWFNDRIINAYFSIIRKEARRKVYCFDSYFMTKLLKKTGHNCSTQENAFEYDLLLIPIHVSSQSHWTLCAVDVKKHEITYYDSLGHSEYGNRHMRAILQFLESEHLEKFGSVAPPFSMAHEAVPRQPNSYDCGLFLCFFGRRLAKGLGCQEDPPSICRLRGQISLEILSGKLMSEDFLQESYNQEMIHTPKECLYISPGLKPEIKPGSTFKNLGNTCFLSSCLQVLFHCSPFVEWIISDTDHHNNCQDDHCITCQISILYADSTLNKVSSPQMLLSKLGFFWDSYEPNSQQDAREFLSALFVQLRKEYLERYSGRKLDMRTLETTPIDDIFGFYTRTEVLCTNCKVVSTTFQQGDQCPLSMTASNTIGQCLENTFTSLKIKDYKCSFCKVQKEAIKSVMFETLPRVLMLNLLRFFPDGTKRNDTVEAETTVNLKKFLAQDSMYKGSTKYCATGAVRHIGLDKAGHYVSSVVTSEGRKLYDDEKVSATTHRRGVGDDFYIIMYEQIKNSR